MHPTLVVTNSAADSVSFVDPAFGDVERVEVGTAPFGITLAPDGRAYVATAEGVAIVDTRQRVRVALVPYRAEIGGPKFGEYRPGGMGIVVSPDGSRVYVGVYLAGRSSRLEIMDTAQQAIIASVEVGVRPFDVQVSRDGREVYSIDHDSFSVTVVDPANGTSRTLDAAPLGRASFDKPHYGVVAPDGHLLLPYQGRVLADLDPATGEITTTPLTSDTHQHGIAATPDGRLLIIGTGPAGSATGGPSLTILNRANGSERVIPLDRPHEQAAVSPDGRLAYLTGGYSFADGGWDGLTIVDLESETTRELPVPDRPLGIELLP